MRPRARQDGIVVRELPDETLVYDLETHKAHCLNRISAAVWRGCDGKRDVPALAGLLERELKRPADEGLVRVALEQLGKAKLFVEPLKPLATSSRREMIRRLGAAAALPAVISILAPTAAQAATCIRGASGCRPSWPDPGSSCTSDFDCCTCKCQNGAGRGG